MARAVNRIRSLRYTLWRLDSWSPQTPLMFEQIAACQRMGGKFSPRLIRHILGSPF